MAKKIDHCKRCGAEIVWMKTKNDKAIPVDAETVFDDETVFEMKRMSILQETGHRSHFATCPYADEFRKRGEKNETKKELRRVGKDSTARF